MTSANPTPFNFQPVIIIGAARSGTNMLRDALTQLPGITTWPCDEINYVWRHHHATFPTDELRSGHATVRVRRYIRAAFTKLAHKTRAQFVVEKTCANSLRVDYVRAVLPEAKIIFLVRDGRDVVASALKRWHAKLELGYTLKKARFVPPGDVPYYAWRYLRHRAHRLVSSEGRVASWGPRFAGIERMLQNCSLAEVCAEQWRVSVELAAKALEKLPADRCHTIRYEDFVRRPISEFARIADFVKAPRGSTQFSAIVKGISTNSVGNWRSQLDAASADLIAPRLRTTLDKWGYLVHESQSISDPMHRAA